jgi:hypothetical protein
VDETGCLTDGEALTTMSKVLLGSLCDVSGGRQGRALLYPNIDSCIAQNRMEERR